VQDAHAGVVDACDAGQLRGLVADDRDPALGRPGLAKNAAGEQDDRDHDRRRHDDDDDAEGGPQLPLRRGGHQPGHPPGAAGSGAILVCIRLTSSES
jgi:hypothetical protein